MTYAQLLETAHACGEDWLETKTGRRFRVGVYMDCPFFVIESSGQGRSDGRKAAEAFVERYNATRSLRTTDYKDVTRNASYFIPLALRVEENS
jgi:hypothetical protein